VHPSLNDSKHIQFPSTLDGLESILRDALKFFEQSGDLSIDTLFGAELILREALVNAIVHGNNSQHEKNVTLTLNVDGSSHLIQISDEGEGFDWKSALKHAYPPGEQDHGRGLLLMRDYGYTMSWNEKGNQLTLFYP
jgi:serine/threonine-protein kinase RsbW